MKCPFCSNLETQVKDSRMLDEGEEIKRRRFCAHCNSRFTTYEKIQFRDITIIKKNSEKELFDANKLRNSIEMAVRKRPISMITVDEIVNGIVRYLEIESDGRINSKDVGELVLSKLREIDLVAYVRFASVYRNFEKISDFSKFILDLSKDYLDD